MLPPWPLGGAEGVAPVYRVGLGVATPFSGLRKLSALDVFVEMKQPQMRV